MERSFKVGEMVLVSDDLKRTYDRFGKSRHDYMERMKGRVFPIAAKVSKEAYKIYNEDSAYHYTFFHLDLIPTEVKDPDPIIVEFDTKYLDI